MNIRVLKALVIGMAVLIVIGVTVVVVTIVTRLQAEPTGDGFGVVQLAIPPGTRLVSVTTEEGRLVLHLDGPEGGWVKVLDLATGATLGEVVLTGDR